MLEPCSGDVLLPQVSNLHRSGLDNIIEIPPVWGWLLLLGVGIEAGQFGLQILDAVVESHVIMVMGRGGGG